MILSGKRIRDRETGLPQAGQNQVVDPHPDSSVRGFPQSGQGTGFFCSSAMVNLQQGIRPSYRILASISLMVWFFMPRFWKLVRIRTASSF